MTRRIVFLLASLGCAFAQPLAFTLLPPGDTAPPVRADGTIAYDPATRDLYLFGGLDGAAYNDLWVYSLPSRRWTELRPPGAIPAARFGHTLVYDSARRRLILFGGRSAAGPLDDTWVFDLATRTWRELTTPARPPARFSLVAGLDRERDRLLIATGQGVAGAVLDDAWALDLSSETWSELNPAGPLPDARYGSAGGMFEAGGFTGAVFGVYAARQGGRR